MENSKKIKLYGKLFLRGVITTRTGLHIGGASTGLEIGGVSSVVVRDPLTNYPYIPGSSLKGKMRSLLEKLRNKEQKKMTEDIYIHKCETKEEYEECCVCKIFGLAPVSQEKKADTEKSSESSEKKPPEEFGKPTRIIVRDAMMNADSVKKLKDAATDLPYTEVKWEAVIDRVTSKAMPRQIERVPAGVDFDFSLCYNIFEGNDIPLFKEVLVALGLLEQDYLGGQGTRGYGQIQFKDLKFFWNSAKDYESGNVNLETAEKEKRKTLIYEVESIESAIGQFDEIIKKIDLESE